MPVAYFQLRWAQQIAANPQDFAQQKLNPLWCAKNSQVVETSGFQFIVILVFNRKKLGKYVDFQHSGAYNVKMAMLAQSFLRLAYYVDNKQ